MATGLEGIKKITDFDLKNKRVFLRLDLNVPIKSGQITDETRIQAALPTIKYALENGAKLIIASHLGRPKGPEDREKNSLEPVARRLGEILNVEVTLVDEPSSEAPSHLLVNLKNNQIILLENLRFDPGEEKNSEEFAKSMASYSDIYINDAFGASHRAHASIVALPQLMSQKGTGFLMAKEIEMLSQLINKPASPYVAILGGAKVSDKIGVIENLLDRVDVFIIGGAMAYTFLKATGHSVGKSRIEEDRLRFARELIERIEARDKSVLLPVDHVVAEQFESPKDIKTVSEIPDGYMGLDIGPKTAKMFADAIANAKTVFWNGPMGVFEKPPFDKGSFAIADALARSSALTVVGGGDSAAAVNASGLGEKMGHISTGGGASLEYLQGDKLPGLEVLKPRRY